MRLSFNYLLILVFLAIPLFQSPHLWANSSNETRDKCPIILTAEDRWTLEAPPEIVTLTLPLITLLKNFKNNAHPKISNPALAKKTTVGIGTINKLLATNPTRFRLRYSHFVSVVKATGMSISLAWRVLFQELQVTASEPTHKIIRLDTETMGPTLIYAKEYREEFEEDLTVLVSHYLTNPTTQTEYQIASRINGHLYFHYHHLDFGNSDFWSAAERVRKYFFSHLQEINFRESVINYIDWIFENERFQTSSAPIAVNRSVQSDLKTRTGFGMIGHANHTKRLPQHIYLSSAFSERIGTELKNLNIKIPRLCNFVLDITPRELQTRRAGTVPLSSLQYLRMVDALELVDEEAYALVFTGHSFVSLPERDLVMSSRLRFFLNSVKDHAGVTYQSVRENTGIHTRTLGAMLSSGNVLQKSNLEKFLEYVGADIELGRYILLGGPIGYDDSGKVISESRGAPLGNDFVITTTYKDATMFDREIKLLTSIAYSDSLNADWAREELAHRIRGILLPVIRKRFETFEEEKVVFALQTATRTALERGAKIDFRKPYSDYLKGILEETLAITQRTTLKPLREDIWNK